MAFNKIKSCKGRYIEGNDVYDITEVLKINEYDEDKNIGLIKFIQSLTVYGYRKYKDIDCLTKEQNALLCRTTLDNMILKKTIKQEGGSKPEVKLDVPKLCKIESKDDEIGKPETPPKWYDNLDSEITHINNLLNDEQKILFNDKFIEICYKKKGDDEKKDDDVDKGDVNKSYYVDKGYDVKKKDDVEYILLPIFLDETYPFLIKRIDEYNKICKMECSEDIKINLIFDFLSNIKFICCIKNPKYNKSVFDFDNSCVTYLEDIKKSIYNYVLQLFNTNNTVSDYSKKIAMYNIKMNIINYAYHKFITIHFSVVNKDKYEIHQSISDLYNSLGINTLITCAKSNTPCSYYIYKRTDNNEKCKDFVSYEKNFTKTYELKFKSDKSKSKLDKSKSKLDKYNSNRFMFLNDDGVDDDDADADGYADSDAVGDDDNYKLLQTLQTLQTNPENIEIISMYYPNNKYHTYCSLSTIIKYNNEYYNFSIKSITMDELDNNREFKKQYKNQFPKLKLYKKFNNNEICYTTLPSCVEIIISKIKDFKYKFNYNFYENYEQSIEHTIQRKTNAKLSIPLILLNIWSRLYINSKEFNIYDYLNGKTINKEKLEENNNFIKLTKLLLSIPLTGVHILGIIKHSENFIIHCKNPYMSMLLYYYHYNQTVIYTKELLINVIINLQCNNNENDTLNHINNKKNLNTLIDKHFNTDEEIITKKFYSFLREYLKNYSISYITWYVSKYIKIINYNKCNEYALKYKEKLETHFVKLIEEKKPFTEFTYIKGSEDEYERDDFKEFTNFFEIYTSGIFLHTFRDLNKTYYDELKNLLQTTEDSNENTLEQYLPFFHYPSKFIYSILHMHIYKNHYINTDTIGNLGEFIDTTFGQTILFDKLLFNKENLIEYTLQLSHKIIVKDAEEYQKTLLESLAGKFPLTDTFYRKKYYKYKTKYIQLKTKLNNLI